MNKFLNGKMEHQKNPRNQHRAGSFFASTLLIDQVMVPLRVST
jgi:hypothetical protein